jgi:hypothetical protein
MGSIPLILERQYGAQFKFTMVEYDEDVAELAQRYSLPRLKGSTEILILFVIRINGILCTEHEAAFSEKEFYMTILIAVKGF